MSAVFTHGCMVGRDETSATAAAGAAESSVEDLADAASNLDRLTLPSGAKLPYYHTYSLEGSSAATQAVVVIHGTGRNARGYFESMVKAADDAGTAQSTAIVAPWFQTDEDDPRDGDAYWTNGDETSWKDGGGALSPSGLSSFAAVDEIFRTLGDKSRFPNLTRIVLVGHSAGGQFVQRYAAGGQAPDELEGIAFKFVSANPSSYLYLSAERPLDTRGCKRYNEYKYGQKSAMPT